MPRAARIVFSSMPYHITSRGNERKKIFLDDGDRKKFLGILEECDGTVIKDYLKH